MAMLKRLVKYVCGNKPLHHFAGCGDLAVTSPAAAAAAAADESLSSRVVALLWTHPDRLSRFTFVRWFVSFAW